LHYGISAFEGISVVKNAKTGTPQAFRLKNNFQSLYDGSEHLDMPVFDIKELQECLKHLIKLDYDWFPELDHPS
jgi:branched-subunit amino acid aminotransferase/4-amino-4-deoxychorismate lyase